MKKSDMKPKNSKKTIIRLIKSIGKWKYSILLAVILALMSTVLMIFGPNILGDITTEAVGGIMSGAGMNWEKINIALIVLIGLYVFSAIVSYLEGWILSGVSAKYSKNLKKQILEKISKLPLEYFDKHSTGDMLSRMTNDVDVVAGAFSALLTNMITSVVKVIGILVMMLLISVPLSMIAMVVVPISVFVLGGIMKKSQSYFKKNTEILAEINSRVEESYTGHLVIQANSREESTAEDFKKINNRLYETSLKSQFLGSLTFPMTHVFSNISYVLISAVGGYLAVQGKILIGEVQAFIQYTESFNRPIASVAQISTTIQQTIAAAERIFDFLDEKEEQDEKESSSDLAVRGMVEFENVNFSYKKDQPVIKNFSCRVEPGTQVAIVGPTGAGKTTIVNLLMRFYEIDSGEIKIDGVSVKDLNRNEVRAMFGMVLQDTWLFSGTIYENLKYGRRDVSLDEVKKVAKMIGIDHLIESLPDGYETKINEDSNNISAGEKQLLTIARAMIAGAPMMILDEATSNVDTRTEQLIQEAFVKLVKNKTSFVIAHRLSTIRNADLILVMDSGNIVEQGNHEELITKNGFYADLYNSQFSED